MCSFQLGICFSIFSHPLNAIMGTCTLVIKQVFFSLGSYYIQRHRVLRRLAFALQVLVRKGGIRGWPKYPMAIIDSAVICWLTAPTAGISSAEMRPLKFPFPFSCASVDIDWRNKKGANSFFQVVLNLRRCRVAIQLRVAESEGE